MPFTSENRTLNLMLYHFAKYELSAALCAK